MGGNPPTNYNMNNIEFKKCKFCGKGNFKKLGNHEVQCSLNPNKGVIKEKVCPICNMTFIKYKELLTHKLEVHGIAKGQQTHTKSFYKCEFCGKEWQASKEQFSFHRNHCEENPDRVEYSSHSVSVETKKKISETQKENYKNGKSRWHIDRSQKSYAEGYFESWLTTFTQFENNYHVDRFYLDFAFPSKKIYFEVDGEQHYTEEYIKRDEERTQILNTLGWTLITRVRWCKFQALSKKDKEDYLNELKNCILSSEVLIKNWKTKKDILEEKKIKKQEKLQNKISLVKNCGIDFSKYGSITECSRRTGLSRKEIYKIKNLL